MAEQFEEQLTAAPLEQPDSLIAGKDFMFYWKTSQLFVVLLAVLAIVNIIVNRIWFGIWIVVAAVAILFTWWLLKRFRVRLSVALTANAMLGLLAGLLVAIFELIWYRQWWYLMDLVRLPLMLGAAAMLVSFIFYIVFQSIIIKNTIKESKGGGMYGGTKI
jgi:hypothetical protein